MVTKKQILGLTLITTFMLLTVISLSNNVIALQDEIEEKIDSAENKAEEAEEIIDTLTNPDEQEEYLKEQWLKIINKGPLKTPIAILNKAFTWLNPFWEKSLKMKYSLSWVFIIALITLSALVEISLDLGAIFSAYIPTQYEKYQGFIRLLIAIALILLGISIKIPKYASIIIVGGISKKGPWWLQIIGLICISIAIFFAMKYSGKIKNSIRENREKIENRKSRQETKTTKKRVTRQRKKTEAIIEVVEEQEKEKTERQKDKEAEQEAEDALDGLGTEDD